MNDNKECPQTKHEPVSYPDPLTETVIKFHYIFLGTFLYVIIYKFFGIYISAFFKFIGFVKIISYVPLLYDFISFILWVIYILCGICSTLLFVILFWIYIHWLLIIIFVPFIIIFPIPIFPFIFILPLKPLMLELIPPFKVLTNTGTLPTMHKISRRVISDETYSNTFNYFFKPTMNDLNIYFYSNIRQMISDIFYYDIQDMYKPTPEKCKTSNQDIINSIETNDNPGDVDKYNEYNENKTIATTRRKIEEDTELCTAMHTKFKEYNSSYLGDISTDIENSFTPYNSCYIGAIKSYIKTNIR